jgi:hypothetical protein
MTRIKFIEVGPEKKSWEEPMPYPTEDRIGLALKRSKALLSRTLQIQYDTNAIGCRTGKIYAGLFTVGRFEIVEDKTP